MNHTQFIQKLSEDKEFKKIYEDKSDISYEYARLIKAGRVKRGLTQAALAEKIGVQQESIARMENPGYSIKYLKTIEKIFIALDIELVAPGFKESVGLSEDKPVREIHHYGLSNFTITSNHQSSNTVERVMSINN